MSDLLHQKGWKGFLETCQQIDSIELLDELFGVLLTQEEREDLAARYLIVKALLKGDKSQRDLSKDLNVSIAKITRGSNALKLIREDLKKALFETERGRDV